MTSHTLAAFRTDDAGSSRMSSSDEDCAFCSIARSHPHANAQAEASKGAQDVVSSSSSSSSPAYVVYSDATALAFLDILPIRRGHTLVIPRRHVAQLSQLPLDEAGALAKALVTVTRIVGTALGDERLQVITNQIYAQVVPHLHFHIVPAPPLPGANPPAPRSEGSKPSTSTASQSLLRAFGHGRDELDDDDAILLTKLMRKAAHQVASETPSPTHTHSDSKSKL